MNNVQKFFDQQYKQWFLNGKGEFSITKVCIQISVISGAIVALPGSMAAVGVSLVIPPAIIAGAKVAGMISIALAGMRAKDTIDEAKKEEPK